MIVTALNRCILYRISEIRSEFSPNFIYKVIIAAYLKSGSSAIVLM
jgi:hypothetical protein